MAREIHQLTLKMSKLGSATKKSTKKQKGRKNRTVYKPRDMFGTAVGTSTAVVSHPDVQKGDPVAVGIAAHLAPFSVPKGMAKKLTDPKQSQAFSARSTSAISVAAGYTLLFFQAPCVASNSTLLSLGYVLVPTGNAADATSVLVSSLASVPNMIYSGMQTNTPYTVTTLSGNDYQWRLVGSAIRIRNVSEQLYRGGLLRYVMDPTMTMNSQINLASTTVSGILNVINSAQHNVRKHFSDDSTVEIVSPAINEAWLSTPSTDFAGVFSGAETGCPGGSPISGYGSGATRFGSTSSSLNCSTEPFVWGYFQNTATGAQTIDMEIVEHWEVHGNDIAILHTPSPNHVQSQALISAVVEHAVTNHSNNPHLKPADLFKQAVKLAHNKQAVKDAGMVASIALAM